MRRDPAVRRAALRRGQRAERLAAWWLRLKGYRILACGWRSRLGEIDLIVTRGDLVAFVEVKRRQEQDVALRAVSLRQRERIARAARLYVQEHSELEGRDLRFDAIILCAGRLPRHVTDAWREESW